VTTNLEIDGRTIVVDGRIPRIARLEQEWCEDVGEPERLIKAVQRIRPKPDILTFCQRLPDTKHKYSYLMELDPIAALPIKSYSYWFEKQIDAAVRNKVRKAHKKGIIVKQVGFDDGFVRGMSSIFNETPVRQGRHFLHYGKDFATIKQQFSRYLFREEIFGAYVGEELVGFIMLADTGKYVYLGQILSKVSYRSFAPNNALLAKAVDRCAEKKAPYLVYASWLNDGLGEFKRSNGFQRFDLPRYFVPVTLRGELALNLGLHRGWNGILPEKVIRMLKKLRKLSLLFAARQSGVARDAARTCHS
jgi:Acetyltransferase (GNAT) domain